jgi:predicted metalloprotease with PDZ domain
VNPRRVLPLIAIVVLLQTAWAAPTVDYHVSLAKRAEHLVGVRMRLPAGAAERDVQLPVWNALYQVRDFAQYVRNVKASDSAGQRLEVRKLDKTTWRITGTKDGANVDYEIFADLPGPFGAQLNEEHAFFNLGEVLMYVVDARSSPITLTFTDIPKTWAAATTMAPGGTSSSTSSYSARSYDRMVDAPVEIGAFTQAFIQHGGATYRIVVHADPADFSMPDVARAIREVTRSEVEWMKDRPFLEYLFILHFPHYAQSGGGGMEHATSCAIEVPADRLRDDPVSFIGLVAHEFFHLWNVKRIRPQSLEPVDYTRENYTDALWFSEGVTTTIEDYTLTRLGTLGESQWLQSLAHDIRELQERPAHLTQSAEESSVNTWFDKYPEYGLPDRSISYYNKGELIGILLDLAIRDATAGHKSLRDLMQYMNRQYAQKDRFFADSEGVRQAVEAITHTDFRKFFEQYVAGVDELPYERYLTTVGLKLERRPIQAPYAGFVSVRTFDGMPVVVRVDANSDAARLGLQSGDTILKINGKLAYTPVEDRVESMRVGETLRLRISGRTGERDVKFKLSSRPAEEFRIVNMDAITPEQRARRSAWLLGESEAPSAAPGAIRAEVTR